MTSTTDTQFSPFMDTFGGTLTQLVDGAAQLARESTKSYATGLNAIVGQQRLAAQASQHWVSALMTVQSNIRQQLVGSYDASNGGLVRTAQESAKLAGEAGAQVAESSSNAAASPTRKQSKAVTRTPRRPAPKSSKSASTNAGRPGPAKWTSEAYEPLTATEIIEKLPQLSQRELDEVETYEKAHRSRQRVLQKITSLRGQEPVTGYDELNVPAVHKQLAEGDAELAARVRDYERPRKSRDGVLHAADAQLSKS